MYISNIKINNFRLLKDFQLSFDKDNYSFSLFIGKNNSGKTSFIHLLDKFLSPQTAFNFNDFNLDLQNQIVQSVNQKILEDNYNLFSISLLLEVTYDQDDNLANFADYILDLDIKKNKIYFSFSYFLDYENYSRLYEEYDKFKAKANNSLKIDTKQYLSNNFRKYFSLKIKSISPHDEDYFVELRPSEITKIINLKLIKAERHVSNDYGTKTLSTLSCKYFNNSEKLDNLKQDLQIKLMQTDNELDELYKSIFEEIKDSFNKLVSENTNLTIKSVLKDDNLLENNTQILYNHDKGMLPEEFNGLGYMNFFAILFDLHIQLREIARMCKENDNQAILNLLFIEEPEAHTHPQMQYIFIRNIESLVNDKMREGISNLQVCVSTHSSHIVSQCPFKYIKYFKNTGDNIQVKNLFDLKMEIKNVYRKKTADKGKKYIDEYKRRYQFLVRYITLASAEIFFADKLIFIEGTTERILMPEFIRKIDKELKKSDNNIIPLSSQNISIVEVGAYSHIFKELIDFLEIKTLIITDIDAITSKREKIPVEDSKAVSTSNQSIINFLGSDKIADLTQKGKNEKIIDSRIMIAYQTKQKGYYARSFEDAFISCNKDYIQNYIQEDDDNDNVVSFNSIIKKQMAKKYLEENNFYSFAQECIESKSGFASELLYHKKTWEIPEYIKEGLKWLAQ